MVSRKSGKTRLLKMILRMLPGQDERLMRDSEQLVMFNMATFRKLPRSKQRESVQASLDIAGKLASEANRTLSPNMDFRAFTQDMIASLSAPGMGDKAVQRLISAISSYRLLCSGLKVKEDWRGSPEFPEYNIDRFPTVSRYGNVELRVIENFLLDPDGLKQALQDVVEKCSDEAEMYELVKRSAKLEHDEPDFNLRRLMTNAGFYVGSEPEFAWEVLSDWAERYISALRNSTLAWHNSHAFHYLRIQTALHEKYGTVPQYVERPSRQQIYGGMAGKEILFVSPLSHIVNDQISSGRIGMLYKNHAVPEFSARAIPAWISTWPNRPHKDWSETFGRMCDAVEASHRERPFEVFIASCGCYGLPICDFARSRFGCSTVYVGHGAHTLFGLFPNEESDEINPEMWTRGDLGRYANMDRIDGGRYI
jgi:hypothetical protein